MTDWKKIRDYFPAVKNSTYLNSAGGGPISVITHKEATAFYDQMLAIGDIPWKDWLTKVETIRKKTAGFIK